MNRAHEQNRRSWNAATVAHNSHKTDQAAFLRGGGTTLFPEEVALLGDLRGKRLVHLQCNAGQDTLCLARLGAKATGVDISDEAVAFAERLSEEAGIPATFVRADVYDWLVDAAAGETRYDVAFCSYGALPWLSDLRTWARGVREILAPGGRLVCMEFHPLLCAVGDDWRLADDHFGGGKVFESPEGVVDYVQLSGAALAPSGYREGDPAFHNPEPCLEFEWTVGDILGAVLDAGLTIEEVKEYPYANGWKGLRGMREGEGRRMFPPEDVPSFPLMLSLSARRPG